MTKRTPKPELAHIPPLILGYLKREKINLADLSELMGRPRNWTGFYPWSRGDGRPIGENRAKLAQLLGVDESELMPKGDISPQMKAAETRKLKAKAHTPKNGAIADTLERQLAETQPVLLPHAVIQPKAQDVLSYSVNSDGQATVRMAARGPHGRMAALFRLLLDAGLVPEGEEEPLPP